MIFPLFDRNPTKRTPWITLLLILVNLGIHGWATTLPGKQGLDLVFEHGFVPERLTEIDSGEPVAVSVEINEGVEYRAKLSTEPTAVYASLLTMMFLHGGWFHVISNVWMLWIFGNNVEDRLGHFVFAGYYLMGGVLASFCQWAIDPVSQTPVVGASGAVWAILGGYAVTYPKAKVFSIVFIGLPIPANLPALLVIGLFFVLDLVQAVLMLNGAAAQPIAHWAHLGGCVAGVVLMPLLSVGTSPPESDWRGEAEQLLDLSEVSGRGPSPGADQVNSR